MSIPGFTSEEQRYQYDLTPDSVVMDLGCYEGSFTEKIQTMYKCRIFAFEPVVPFFEKCELRLKETPGVRLINMAVGDREGTVSGKVKGDMSGLYADEGLAWEAAMIPMDKALDLMKADQVDLLKINIEGSEFQLLEDMVEKNLLSRFTNIQIQWHSVVPDYQERFDALQTELAKAHHLTFDGQWVWQNWEINK